MLLGRVHCAGLTHVRPKGRPSLMARMADADAGAPLQSTPSWSQALRRADVDPQRAARSAKRIFHNVRRLAETDWESAPSSLSSCLRIGGTWSLPLRAHSSASVATACRRARAPTSPQSTGLAMTVDVVAERHAARLMSCAWWNTSQLVRFICPRFGAARCLPIH
jgi:hypothetical protein